MKIFITGSTGFVGSRLVKKLSGHKITKYKRGDNFSGSYDLIYHLASELHDESKMYESNVLLTQKLVKAFPGTKIVYVGSSTEYGNTINLREEADVCKPVTLYALTKYLGTKIIQNKKNIILRPSLLYGYTDKGFFIDTANKIKKGQTVDLWEGSADWLHVEDLVGALIHFGFLDIPGQIINIGTGIKTTNSQIVSILERHFGKANINNIKGAYRSDFSPMWIINVLKASYFNWNASIDIERGIKKVIRNI
jgi:nucleoside-diphosphate-sugar epimerase